MSISSKRPIDVLIWGVSGYTGRLAAAYVAKTYGSSGSNGLTYALGGRSQDKLMHAQQLMEEEFNNSSLFLTKGEKWTNPKIFVSNLDESSHSQLISILQNCSVVVTFAGPFTAIGEHLVKCCVSAGTHYCDSTGELDFVKNMYNKYNQSASDKKLKIISACGFDYVPSDMGVFGASEAINKLENLPTTSPVQYTTVTQSIVTTMHQVSQGTLKSGIAQYGRLTTAEFRSMLGNPLKLCDSVKEIPSHALMANRSANIYPLWCDELGVYVCPFIMTGGLTKHFHWNNYLSNYSCGKGVVYTVGIPRPNFFRALMSALLNLFLELFVFILSRFEVLKNRFTKPETGSGPDLSKRKHCMKTSLCLKKKSSKSSLEDVYEYHWKYPRGEAYMFTGMSCVEAAVAIAKESESCPANFGVITPSLGLGSVYLNRMKTRGLETSFSRVSVSNKK